MKTAFVTGATGQDGQYLCEFLIEKGYQVHGLRRTSSSERTYNPSVIWHDGDLTDGHRLRRIVLGIWPNEIYNLAAQSHVGVSFEQPELTFQVNAVGVISLLNVVRQCGAEFYQASTSEMFGSSPPQQDELTGFHPRSPYGVAKLAAYWMTVNYREAYGLYACNGILFNHESPRRGPGFVTRKITKAVAGFTNGRTEPLTLGNLDAMRDWGHARDYVRGMWMIMQQPKAGDYVLASGESRTVREFVTAAFNYIGKTIRWVGIGLDEKGFDANTGKVLVEVHPEYFRPAEVSVLQGNASKAFLEIGWKPEVKFSELVSEMVSADIKAMS